MYEYSLVLTSTQGHIVFITVDSNPKASGYHENDPTPHLT